MHTDLPPTTDKTAPLTEGPSPLQQAIRWFREKIGGREGSIREMLEEALEEESGGDQTISADEKKLLKNLIHFGELTARDVMVPRTDILGVEVDVTFDALQRHVVEIGHTRIPVYEDSLDKIIGFLHVKDLFTVLASGEEFAISRCVRDIIFIPPSMRIVDLLMKMRVSGCHMAIVVDEYGGTDGLVTMEDLFEELVGEIQDEHDAAESAMLHWHGDQILEADARVLMEDLEAALGTALDPTDSAEYDTLGGFVAAHLGRVPTRGEVLKLSTPFKIEVLAADPRRIRSLRITRLG